MNFSNLALPRWPVRGWPLAAEAMRPPSTSRLTSWSTAHGMGPGRIRRSSLSWQLWGTRLSRSTCRLWGFGKVRYRGLAKNATRAFTALALANIYLSRSRLMAQVRPGRRQPGRKARKPGPMGQEKGRQATCFDRINPSSTRAGRLTEPIQHSLRRCPSQAVPARARMASWSSGPPWCCHGVVLVPSGTAGGRAVPGCQ